MQTINEFRNKIILGDVLEVLKTLPDESVDCVMTSPPYWSLRDYGLENTIWGGDEKCEHDFDFSLFKNPNDRGEKGGQFSREGVGATMSKEEELRENNSGFCKKCNAWSGCLGLEPTIDLFIKHLADIFDEVMRVLKSSGGVYVNLGDTYGKSSTTTNSSTGGNLKQQEGIRIGGYRDKSLCQIPSRFAIEMADRGWILRNEIIWHKPSCMPSSANDRYTVDFEKIFFFTKKKNYFFEMPFEEAVGDGEKRNRRCVWKVHTHSYSEAHFATYPPDLLEAPIKASSPEFICKKCGEPRKKILKVDYKIQAVRNKDEKYFKPDDKMTKKNMAFSGTKITSEEGLTDCGCGVGFNKGIVLDIFSGSGTTAFVARELGRDYIGIEKNSEYIKLSDKRLSQQTLI